MPRERFVDYAGTTAEVIGWRIPQPRRLMACGVTRRNPHQNPGWPCKVPCGTARQPEQHDRRAQETAPGSQLVDRGYAQGEFQDHRYL